MSSFRRIFVNNNTEGIDIPNLAFLTYAVFALVRTGTGGETLTQNVH